jgi:hypothetical protein
MVPGSLSKCGGKAASNKGFCVSILGKVHKKVHKSEPLLPAGHRFVVSLGLQSLGIPHAYNITPLEKSGG